uniref:Uncharacterized protein n=1 Tax=Rhizophora mucronata TaxID=61149 RepID=A0A2P2NA98_RHIMU
MHEPDVSPDRFHF